MRQFGKFYWVKVQGEWVVGQWDDIWGGSWYITGSEQSVSDAGCDEIDPHPITRPTRTLRADELTREQATELIKIITQDVDHSRIQVLDISSRRIKYLNGAQYEGEPVEQVLRFDALHPKQFVLLMEWGYDLFNTL